MIYIDCGGYGTGLAVYLSYNVIEIILVCKGSIQDIVEGALIATDGDLQDAFGIGNLIALEFNRDVGFSVEMFNSDFSGEIDGRIEGESIAVPEPVIPA